MVRGHRRGFGWHELLTCRVCSPTSARWIAQVAAWISHLGTSKARRELLASRSTQVLPSSDEWEPQPNATIATDEPLRVTAAALLCAASRVERRNRGVRASGCAGGATACQVSFAQVKPHCLPLAKRIHTSTTHGAQRRFLRLGSRAHELHAHRTHLCPARDTQGTRRAAVARRFGRCAARTGVGRNQRGALRAIRDIGICSRTLRGMGSSGPLNYQLPHFPIPSVSSSSPQARRHFALHEPRALLQ